MMDHSKLKSKDRRFVLCINNLILCCLSSGIKGFHSISYTWYGFLAVSVALIVGSVVSLLTGSYLQFKVSTKTTLLIFLTKMYKGPTKPDPQLTISLVDKIVPCLPPRIRKLLNCGFSTENQVEK